MHSVAVAWKIQVRQITNKGVGADYCLHMGTDRCPYFKKPKTLVQNRICKTNKKTEDFYQKVVVRLPVLALFSSERWRLLLERTA